MKKIIALLLALTMVFSLAACGGGAKSEEAAAPASQEAAAPASQEAAAPAAQEAAPASEEAAAPEEKEEITLTIWLNSLISADDLLLDEEDWYINQAIKRFQEKYPYVKFDVTKSEDGNTSAALFKAAAASGSAPDICEFWTGEWMFDVEDMTLDIYDKLSPERQTDLQGWANVCRDYDTNNKKIGVPIAVQTVAGIYYNKNMIAEAGLDFENNPPKTTDELLEACAKIKEAGYTPFLADEGEKHEMIYYIANYWWLQQSGFSTIVAENKGEKKYADDEGLIKTLEFYQQLVDNGYINEDTLNASDARGRFMSGIEGAMMGSSSSKVQTYSEALGEDVLGFIKPGDLDTNGVITNCCLGGAGQGLVVSKDTKYPEECIAFIDFLTSPEEFKEYFKHNPTCIPNLASITAEDLGVTNPVTIKMLSMTGDVVFYTDNCVDSDAMNELMRYTANLINHTMTPKEVAEAMDKVIEAKQ